MLDDPPPTSAFAKKHAVPHPALSKPAEAFMSLLRQLKEERWSLLVNYQAHRLDLFTVHRLPLLLFLLAAALDAASTTHFMKLVGPQIETNWYIRHLAWTYGYVAGPLLGKLYQLFALWGFSLLAPRLTRPLCLFITAINLTAALANYLTHS